MSDDPKARLAALEQLDEDLFDFPDVHGVADLIAASRAEAASSDPVRAPLPKAPQAVTPPPTPASPPQSSAAPKAPLPAPKPATPKNEGDLDEDLFGFGELLDLGANSPAPSGVDPDGEDDLDVVATETRGSAAAPARAPEPTTAKAAPSPAPQPAPAAAAAPAPAPAQAAAPPAPEKERKAKEKKKDAKPTVVVREKKKDDAPKALEPTGAAPVAASAPQPALVGAGAPMLQFPASLDLPPAKSKLLWVLVACFLLANGGVFLITKQQNENVNRALVAVTTTLADAVAKGAQAAPPAPRLEVQTPVDQPVDETPRPAPPILDPSDYTNTHEFGVEAARKLIELGDYADARRTLYMVLANQDRGTPMAPELSEDIHYLIALTYYDQGRSIAPEERR